MLTNYVSFISLRFGRQLSDNAILVLLAFEAVFWLVVMVFAYAALDNSQGAR